MSLELRRVIEGNWRRARRRVRSELDVVIRRVGGLTRAFLRAIPARAARLYYRAPREERPRIIREAARTGRMFGMFIGGDAADLARRIVRARRDARFLRRFLGAAAPPSVSRLLMELGLWAERFERRGFSMLAYYIRDIRARKIEELWVGDEACSGMDIVYAGDAYLVVDPDTGEVVRSESAIYVEVTATMTTGGGHEPIAVEAHGVSAIPPMPPEGVRSVEEAIERAMFRVARDRWGPHLARAWERASSLYNGERHAESAGLYPVAVPEHPRILYVEEARWWRRTGELARRRRYPPSGYFVIGAGGEYLGEVG